MSDWQPIATAPRDGTRILAFTPNYPGRKGRKNLWRVTWWRLPEDDVGYIGWGEFSEQWAPTHWQPLTEPGK